LADANNIFDLKNEEEAKAFVKQATADMGTYNKLASLKTSAKGLVQSIIEWF